MDGLLTALRSGQQCDDDGVMCIVSRQACHEAADEIERLLTVLRQSRDAMVKMRGDLLELQCMISSQGDAKTDT